MATKAIGKGYRLTKSGKLEKVPVFRDASAKAAYRKSKRNRTAVAKCQLRIP